MQPPFKLRNANDVRSVAEYSYNIQGSYPTARMRRLVGAFTGLTYHIVRNLMPRL